MTEEEIQTDINKKPFGYYYAKYVKPKCEDPEYKAKRNKNNAKYLNNRYHNDEEYRKAQLDYLKKYRVEHKEQLREYYKQYMLKRKALLEVKQDDTS